MGGRGLRLWGGRRKYQSSGFHHRVNTKRRLFWLFEWGRFCSGNFWFYRQALCNSGHTLHQGRQRLLAWPVHPGNATGRAAISLLQLRRLNKSMRVGRQGRSIWDREQLDLGKHADGECQLLTYERRDALRYLQRGL